MFSLFKKRAVKMMPLLLPIGVIWLMSMLMLAENTSSVFGATCTQSLGSWQRAASAPGNHQEAAVGFIDQEMYIIGGFASYNNGVLGVTNKVHAYDPYSNSWRTLRNAPFDLSHAQGAVDGRYIWVAGGFVGDNPGTATDKVWRYDTQNDTWLSSSSNNANFPPLPDERASGALVRVGRELHYIGGVKTNRRTVTNNHWVLNLDNPTQWRSEPVLPYARNHMQGVVIDGVIYLVGGQVGHDGAPNVEQFHVNRVDAYDTRTNTWQRKADLPAAISHAEASLFVVNGRIISMGGKIPPDSPNDHVFEYNPDENRWTRIASLPTPLIAPVAHVFGNKIFVTNGGTAWNEPQTRTWVATITETCIANVPPVVRNDDYVIDGSDPMEISWSMSVIRNDYDTDSDVVLTTRLATGSPYGSTVNMNQNGTFTYTPSQSALEAGEDYFTYVANDGEDDSEEATVTISSLSGLDSPTGNWITYPSPNDNSLQKRHENAFVEVGGLFYLMGGRGQTARAVNIWNPQTNSWSRGSTSPSQYTNFHHFQAIEYDNLVYVLGAYYGEYPRETAVPRIYIYDPLMDTWSAGPSIPSNRRRGSAGAVVYNDKIYVVGGSQNGHGSGSTTVNWFDEYDPTTNEWRTLPNAPHIRDHFSVAIIDDKMYVTAGRDTSQTNFFNANVAAVDVYDFNTGSWSTLPSSANLPTLRAGASSVAYQDYILVIGGESGSKAHNETEALDTRTNTWVTMDNINTQRHATQAVACGNAVYTAGGSNDNGGDPSTELISPERFSFVSNPAPCPIQTIVAGTVQSNVDAVNFGDVVTGNRPTRTVTITNSGGNQAILIADIDTNNNKFSVSVPYSLPLLLRPGDSLDLTVRSDATSEDEHTGTLTIEYNNPTRTETVALSSNVVVPPAPPVANDDSYETDYETVLNVSADGVLANDTDINDDNITAVARTNAQTTEGGRVTLNTNGSFTYTPPDGFSGEDSFTYRATDGNENSELGTVTITVGENPTPLAENDSYDYTRTFPNQQAFSSVLENDSDPNGDDITAGSVSATANGGTVSINEDGTFTYIPSDAAATAGQDSFTYKADDGNSQSSTATVTITVPNPTPVAVADSFDYTATFPDQQILGNVLDNDTDPNNDNLIALNASSATNGGTVNLNEDGTLTYTPSDAAATAGTDTFTYQVNDGNSASNTVEVTITVPNPAPIAVDDTLAYTETFNAEQVLGTVLDNDNDPNNEAITAALVSQPTNGSTVSLNEDGTFSFIPSDVAATAGQDTFTYQVSDGSSSDTATVTVTIENPAPITSADRYGTGLDTPLSIIAPGVLVNDSDPNSDSITAVALANADTPNGGVVTVNTDGSFDYTPANGFSGDDTFTYQVTDGNSVVDGTVTISVVGNPVPVAVADSYSTPFETQLTIEATNGVLVNDTDADNETIEALTFVNAITLQGGLITLNADGAFIYTPPSHFSGEDGFIYQITDGTTNSAPAMVTITIQENPAPLAADDRYTTPYETMLTIDVPGVLENDSDANGDTLTVVLIQEPANGDLTLNSDGSFTYDPDAGFSGDDAFIYRATDGVSRSNRAKVVITVEDSISTPEPTETVTSTPEPTATATETATSTPEPTATATETATSTPEPTATSTPIPTVEITPNPTTPAPGSVVVDVDDNSVEATPILTWITIEEAEWYQIIITDELGNVILEEWIEASTVCDANGNCTLDTEDLLPFGVDEGDYTVVVTAWVADENNPSEGTIVEVGQTDFTVENLGPIDLRTGRVILRFEDDPDVSWIRVWMGSPAPEYDTLHLAWYEIATSAVCDGTICTLLTDAHPTNGNYIVFMQQWDGELSGWNGPFAADLNFQIPTMIGSPNATVADGQPTFTWQASDNATWYQIWVGVTDPSTYRMYLQWHSAVDLGCADDGICSLTPNAVTLPSGYVYEWYVQAWGPGGYSTGGIEGWGQGNSIVP